MRSLLSVKIGPAQPLPRGFGRGKHDWTVVGDELTNRRGRVEIRWDHRHPILLSRPQRSSRDARPDTMRRFVPDARPTGPAEIEHVPRRRNPHAVDLSWRWRLPIRPTHTRYCGTAVSS